MIIHEITPSVDYSSRLKSLNTQLNEPTNQNSLKVLKVVKLANNKTLGTSVINIQMFTPSLGSYSI